MVFFVDPMSSGNMERYDVDLLRNITNYKVFFYGNIAMKERYGQSKLIYRYNQRKDIFYKVFSYINSQVKLFKEVKKVNPEIIHFQWFKMPFFDYLLIKAIKNKGTKIIFTAHDILPHDTNQKYKKIYNKIYNVVDAIIVHSQNSKEEIMTDFNIEENKIYVIPHGVIKISHEDFVLENIANKVNLGKIKLAFLGNIQKYKGIDFLIEAWLEFEKKYKNHNLQLIIAGKGDIPKKDLLSRSSNVVIDNKLLTDDEFYSYLKLADIILLPYREISQSGVLFNALAEKKLIIATDKGGIGEPYKLFNLGWLITKSNVAEELIEIFEEINQNPDILEKKELSPYDWQRIEEYYSWQKIGEMTEIVYSKAINKVK